MATHRINKATTTTWEIDETGDTWILGENGSITGDIDYGIVTVGLNDAATIRIDGKIVLTDPAPSVAGISIESNKAEISIGATGRISGAAVAIQYIDDMGACSIDNDGLLMGFDGISSLAHQGSTGIRNDGTIRVVNTGITATGAGARIVNSGIIKAEQGIDVNNGAGDSSPLQRENATHIVNTGRITGSDTALWAGGVAVNIRNKGTLNGDVLMGEGHDVFNTSGGTFNGILYGGDGNDVVTLASPATLYVELAGEGVDMVRINSTYRLGANVEYLTLLGKANHAGIGNGLHNSINGNKGANALYGLDGFDGLDGGRGRDRLDGGDGDDSLNGDAGNDILTGGAGADRFVFRHGSGRDTITDFVPGLEEIWLGGFAGVADFNDLQDLMTQPGDDTIIRLSDNDVLILRDVTMGELTTADFAFFA